MVKEKEYGDYFEITRKVNWKRNGEIWRLMRSTEMHDTVVTVTMETVCIAKETNIYWWT